MLEIKFYENIQKAGIEILVTSIENDRFAVFNLYTGEGRVISENELIPDELIMKIPRTLLRQGFLKAFAKAIRDYGVNLEEESTIRGKHEAQSAHLADLQQILKTQRIM